MRPRSAPAARGLGAALLLSAARAGAQAAGSGAPPAARPIEAPVAIGSLEDDWLRTSEIAGVPGAVTPSFRSAGTTRGTADRAGADTAGPARRDSAGEFRARGVRPSVRAIYNSRLPYGPNENGLWAGRGASVLVRGGVVADAGYFRIVVLPQIESSQNAAFAFRPATGLLYSPFASPWWTGTLGLADVPTRFGDRAYTVVTLGQSSATYTRGGLAAGLSTEDEWWGPALRNPVFLSNTAEGFPHAFVRTSHPLRTRFGEVEARYLIGVLTPSPFFARPDVAPSYRSYNAAAVTLRPAVARSLTLGLERSAVSDAGADVTGVFSHAIDVLRGWPRRASDGRYKVDPLVGGFARLALPADGIEAYAEWATETPANSLRRFLLAPYAGQGYTLGLQYLGPVGSSRASLLAGPAATAVRVRVEATNLEQSIAFRDEPIPVGFYAGGSSPGGYTNRGQVLGAGIGPSGQSQWIAVDVLRGMQGARRAGVAITRIRWNNDALYAAESPNFFRHDVSLLASANVGWRTRVADVSGDVTYGKRYNYQFQNGFVDPGLRRTVDVPNTTVGLSFTPR